MKLNGQTFHRTKEEHAASCKSVSHVSNETVWQINPFQNLQVKLPTKESTCRKGVTSRKNKPSATDHIKVINDVRLTEKQLSKLAQRATEVASNPSRTWERDTILVQEVKRKFNGISSYRVESLRNKAKVLCSQRSSRLRQPV